MSGPSTDGTRRGAMGKDSHTANVARRPLISVVVPCYDEQEVFPLLAERLAALADTLRAEADCDCELIFIDDGSGDSTWSQICALAETDSRVRGVRLSRNFGQQAALTCGYSLSAGGAVVCLDADLQDPPEVVPEMVARWREGYDVVYGIRQRREGETVFKLLTARVFYWLIRAAGAKHIPMEAGEFRLMSRRSVDALLRLGEPHRFLRGMVSWIGFRTAEVRYQRQARAAGTTKWPLRNMLRLAADAMLSFTRLPLRLAYYAALLLSVVFVGYFVYALVMYFQSGEPPSSLTLAVLLAVIAFGATSLLSQAILGQYVGRIYQQCQGRPLYLVQECTGGAERTEPDVRHGAWEEAAVEKSPIEV